MSRPVSGCDFIVLSTQDWDALPTRKHRFARMFAEQGNRVLYVEQQMHWAGWLVDVTNQFGRAWRWLKGAQQVEPDVWIFTLPIVLPFFQMNALINAINNLFLLPVLKWQLKRLGFGEQRKLILWTYTPHSDYFVDRLGEYVAVYECVDEFTASKGLVSPRVIGRLEQTLLEKVDLLIATADGLYESKRDYVNRAVVVPNGAETDHFGKAADSDLPIADVLRDVQHPVVGFLGSIQYWIDIELLEQVARTHPEWTVALVGPEGLTVNLEPLKRLPNVVATGRVDYRDVPSYVKAFDVCLNPYYMNEVAEHCSPLKLYEYLATGKRIVSVDMPEAHHFDNLIAIAHSRDEFVSLVEKAVSSSNDDGLAVRQMEEAKKHTWRRRFEDASAALLSVLETKP